ncbi:hypothetical protein M430DRAFT_101556, partial [Amorphotheca resinae ATCC 22711]
MPTRVIDVDIQNGSNEVRLFHPPKGYNFPYVALSHCWGTSKVPISCKTTRGNILNHQKQILTSNLPSTFQDAVYIARKLNIRYLWIDSLCIIQDDADDWEIESAKMASIYQNAYLTIAATASASSQDSLLNPRLPATSLRKSPLLRRAWAFQEMILSPRVLHFAEDQLYWQCRNDLFSEDGLVRLVSPLQSNFRSGKFISQDEYGGYKLWWEWIQVYSTLGLSHTGDKAAALAGLTNMYLKTREAGDQPLAGLWRNDLHFGLLWYSVGSRRLTYLDHVPSWSWFKVDGPI